MRTSTRASTGVNDDPSDCHHPVDSDGEVGTADGVGLSGTSEETAVDDAKDAAGPDTGADDRRPDAPANAENAAQTTDSLEDAAFEDANLEKSLDALSRLSSSRMSLEDLLVRVAENAVRAIPGADGAGLTLLEPDRADIIVKSAEFVRTIDDIQYQLGEGPCITAALTGKTMRSGSLGGDARWPRFGPRAGRLGVHSVLSLPLQTPTGVVGAMNVYAHAHDSFDERSVQLGEVFAGPAAVTVHNAQILAQTARLATQLQSALATRPMIEQAIGILRARSGIDAVEAFKRLRQLSQTEHVKLATVAERIVDEAVRRAQSRRTGPR